MKVALVTGITGQDGSYLAELLLEKGYKVHGFVRRSSSMNRERIDHLKSNPDFSMIYGDLCDSSSINSVLRNVMPDEVYNLAAQSHVQVSFEMPDYTADANGVGVVRLLEAIRRMQEETGKSIRFYQASTSEMFGKVVEPPQKETPPFSPRSPYGCAKLYAYWITKNYRESYGLYACNGILFNHESPRRGENFVTRKITMEIAKIKEGVSKCFYLGNLDAKRDWGHAKDFVNAMWLMLQQEKPDDYVIATGENHSVREFIEEAFKIAGIAVKSNGKKGLEEEYVRQDTGETVVKIDKRHFRPAEVDVLLGDASKAERILNWKPSIGFRALIKDMIESDITSLRKTLYGQKER